MPATPHIERHFTGSQTVRDVVIGMADGLTVPFALAAGLSAAVSSSKLIVTAGLAEIAAGAIAMGLGGYLAARSDQEHYDSEVRREQREIRELPERERDEVRQALGGLGLAGEALETVTSAISAEPGRWTDFMMRFELGLERPDPKRAPLSAVTIGGSYLVGGMIPLAAYILLPTVNAALPVSVGATALALLLFGGVKGRLTGVGMVKSAVQTLIVGALAAAVAFELARLIA